MNSGSSYHEYRDLLAKRLAEPAPGRIQLLAGPRQVGKTTLLAEVAEQMGDLAVYAAADAPEAALPGFWEAASGPNRGEGRHPGARHPPAGRSPPAQWLGRSAQKRLGQLRRRKTPVHIVASGSSALHISSKLAGEPRRTVQAVDADAAGTGTLDRPGFRDERRSSRRIHGSHGFLSGGLPSAPGQGALVGIHPRRDSSAKPLDATSSLLRRCVVRPYCGRSSVLPPPPRPRSFRSRKFRPIAGRRGSGNHRYYLELLEAFLVAPLQKYSARAARRRSAPPKLVTLNNALVAVADTEYCGRRHH